MRLFVFPAKQILIHPKLIDGGSGICFPRTQSGTWESRLVGTIWIMLRLKAQTAAEWVCHAFFSHETAIKEVASIELHTRLVGIYRHLDARCRVIQSGSYGIDIAMGVEQPVVVISASVDNLLVGSVVDSITYAGRGTEVEGSILYRSDLACYRYIGIDWCVSIGIEIEYLIHDITSRVATEAEVAVVGEIDDSRFVGSGFVGNGDSVVVGECIGYLDR